MDLIIFYYIFLFAVFSNPFLSDLTRLNKEFIVIGKWIWTWLQPLTRLANRIMINIPCPIQFSRTLTCGKFPVIYYESNFRICFKSFSCHKLLRHYNCTEEISNQAYSANNNHKSPEDAKNGWIKIKVLTNSTTYSTKDFIC